MVACLGVGDEGTEWAQRRASPQCEKPALGKGGRRGLERMTPRCDGLPLGSSGHDEPCCFKRLVAFSMGPQLPGAGLNFPAREALHGAEAKNSGPWEGAA